MSEKIVTCNICKYNQALSMDKVYCENQYLLEEMLKEGRGSSFKFIKGFVIMTPHAAMMCKHFEGIIERKREEEK